MGVREIDRSWNNGRWKSQDLRRRMITGADAPGAGVVRHPA